MKYKAFISYSHSVDLHLAKSIQTGLQLLGKPWHLEYAFEIFRDETNLSTSPHLWTEIESALKQSEFFILLASPKSAASKWVALEVEYWVNNRPIDTLILALTEGDIVLDDRTGIDWERSTSLPSIFKGKFTGMPLYVDFRPLRSSKDLSVANEDFIKVLHPIAARLHNKTVAEMFGEVRKQHLRTLRLRNIIVSVLSILLLAAIITSIIAVNRTGEAKRQRDQAEAEKKIAQARYLIAEGLRLTKYEPRLSVLLALEAINIKDSVEARRTLFSMIRTDPHLAMRLFPTKSPVTALTFRNDGGYVVVGLENGEVFLWRVSTKQSDVPLNLSLSLDKTVKEVAFNNTGEQIVAVDIDGAGKVWNTNDGTLVYEWNGTSAELKKQGEPAGMALSLRGDVLVIGSLYRGVEVKRPYEHKMYSIKKKELGIGESIAVDSEGQRFATLVADDEQKNHYNRVGIFEVRTGELSVMIQFGEHPLPATPLALTKKLIAIGRMDGSVEVYSINKAKAPETILQHEPNPYQRMNAGLGLRNLIFGNSGKLLISLYRKQAILWDVGSGAQVGILSENSPNAVAIDPKETAVSFAGNDGAYILEIGIQVWKRRACALAERNLTRAEWRQYIGNDPYRCTCFDEPECRNSAVNPVKQ